MCIRDRDGNDLKAREHVAYGSTMAGITMQLTSTTAQHSMEHAMSAYHPNLPHGAGLILISKAFAEFFIERHACDGQSVSYTHLDVYKRQDLGNSFDRKYFLMGKNEMQMYNTPGANIDPVAVFAKNHKVSDQNYSASSNPPKPTESRVTSKPSETLSTESNVTSNPSDTPSESEINSSAGSSYTEKMPTDIVMVDIVQEPIISRTVFEQAKQAGLDLKLNGDTYSLSLIHIYVVYGCAGA